MAYTTALAQWTGSQCVHNLRQPSRCQLHKVPRTALVQTTYRKANLRQHVTHATGTEIRDEDLQSAGNQDKARDLQVDEQIEDAEREEEFEEQMERGLEADEAEGTTVQDELAALEVETEQPEPAQFALNFLWLNKNIAVAVDQLFDEVTTIFCTVCPSSRQCCGRICWLHCLLCWLL
ncbi:hypothetical protein ABBQ32_000385 [Trebouxia sp. C0010 RCD-2024]